MSYFKRIWAERGQVTKIPINNQGDGGVSFEEGWNENYELDISKYPDDAKELSRRNFNGLFMEITGALQQFQIYGINPYITASDNDGEVFPYPLGGTCSYIDPVTNEYGEYVSLRSNNTTVPSQNGVTTRFWQKIFNPSMDSLKTNRVTNSILYYTTLPSYSETTAGTTFTIHTNTKLLFSNGFNTDNTMKTNIVQLNNNIEAVVPPSANGAYYIFATDAETAVALDVNGYSTFTSESEVISEKGSTSSDDLYYFNSVENKWKRRVANSSMFNDSPVSMCLMAIASISQDSVDSFTVNEALHIVDYNYLSSQLATKQQNLQAGKNINMAGTSNNTTMISAIVPLETTQFSVNSCNLDDDGEIDLLYSDSVVVPATYEPTISEFGTNGNRTTAGFYNPENMWGTIGTSNSAYLYRSGNSSNTVNETFTFFEPVEITYDAYVSLSHNSTYAYSYNSRDRGTLNSVYGTFSVIVNFTDGTNAIIYTSNKISENRVWRNYQLPIPPEHVGKSILSITFSQYYYIYLYTSIRGRGTSYTSSFYSYVSGVQIQNKTSSIQHQSNKLYFKTGSNYRELLDNTDNATSMITADNGSVVSSESAFNQIWGSASYLCPFEEWWTGFITKFTFLQTPAETINAKLFIRFNNTTADGVLDKFSVKLTYFGGTTQILLDNVSVFKTEDLLIDIPEGKYIQSIEISSTSMKYLGGCSLGMVQLYNNVSESLDLVQYPAIYATSGDGSLFFMLNNVPAIDVSVSGYVMLSQNGAYILQGSNVIRRTKIEPTIASDPALRDGDIWLDYGAEPLVAYQRKQGNWVKFYDVPVGFVTLEEVSGQITVTDITQYDVNQNGYYLNTFSKNLGSLSGKDGRDGQNGRDGKNGADGAQGAAGIGVITGGLKGQVLAKNTNANYDMTWANAITDALFNGGTTGQVLTKTSDEDLAFDWEDTAVSLPSGGVTGQSLVKKSDADFDVEWQNASGGLVQVEALNYKVDMLNLARNLVLDTMLLDNLTDTNNIDSSKADGQEVIDAWDSATQSISIPSGSLSISFQTTLFELPAIPRKAMVSVRYAIADHVSEGEGATLEIYVSRDGGRTWYEVENEMLEEIPDMDIDPTQNNIIAKITFSGADVVLKGFCIGVQL